MECSPAREPNASTAEVVDALSQIRYSSIICLLSRLLYRPAWGQRGGGIFPQVMASLFSILRHHPLLSWRDTTRGTSLSAHRRSPHQEQTNTPRWQPRRN